MHTAQPERELMRARVVQRTRLETRLHPDRRRDRTLRHRDPPWTGGCAKRALEFNIKSGPAVTTLQRVRPKSRFSASPIPQSTLGHGRFRAARHVPACADRKCDANWRRRRARRGSAVGCVGTRVLAREGARQCQKQGRVVVGTRTYTRHPRSAIPPSRVCWRRGERRQQ